MDNIRPSLNQLRASEYDELAFPELDGPPSVRVSRVGPPIVSTSTSSSRVQSTAVPSAVPTFPKPSSPPPAVEAPPPKPKSRFALQREREAAERLAAEADGTESRGGGALPKASGAFSLIGNVVERSSSSPPLPPSAPGPSAPSPLAQKKHAFGGFPSSTRMGFPRKVVEKSEPDPSARKSATVAQEDEGVEEGLDGLLKSVSRENERVIEGMSEEDILEEQRAIRESLGLSPAVLKMLEARGSKPTPREKKKVAFAPPPQSAPTTRPLPAGISKTKAPVKQVEEDLEEGSPEYIRRHFFPDEPRNPALDWMRAPSSTRSTSDSTPGIAFDLTGAVTESSETHSHGGEGHHGGSSEKFSLGQLMHLTSSSVPSQRSSALLVLGRVLAHEPSHATLVGHKEWNEARLRAGTLAGQALADKNLGVQAGAVGLLAVLLPGERGTPPPEVNVSGAEPAPTLISSLLGSDPLLALSNALALGALPPSAQSQALDILCELLDLHPALTAAPDGTSLASRMVLTPHLLEAIAQRFVGLSWPPLPNEPAPIPRALRFLTALSRTSRTAAKALVERKLHEHPLRFLAMAPWDLDSSSHRALGYTLLSETFEMWEALARYGLGTHLWTQGAALFAALNGRLEEGHKEDEIVRMGWLRLLGVWATAATDPHVSEHDILWSQVQGWEMLALSAIEWAQANGGAARHAQLVSAAWDLLAAWVEGSKVNKSWRGEQERAWIGQHVEFGSGTKGREVLEEALRRGDDALVLSAVRLSDAHEDKSSPATGPLITWTQDELVVILGRPATSWHGVRLRVALLPRIEHLEVRLRATVELLPLLRVGDEVAARDMISILTSHLSNPSELRSISALSSLDKDLEAPALAQLDLLRPFLTHALVKAGGGRVHAPLYPIPKDLRLTASLPGPEGFAPLTGQKRLLSASWPLAALDELLRSATSTVLQQLPPDWPGSELLVVRASLALLRVTQLLSEKEQVKVPPPELVYELIKVYMLEKDHPTPAQGEAHAIVETDLFRDRSVSHSISHLLDSISLGARLPLKSAASGGAPPLEVVSARVSTAPLFQLYSDLLGLYASISLGDPLFSRILLPFLRTCYAVDYKRLLWVDQSELLRSLKTCLADTPSDAPELGVKGWLYPEEGDEVLLLAYADALVKGRVKKVENELLHLIATHHLALALFDSKEGAQKQRRRLAGALVQPGRGEILLGLIKYGQGSEEEVLLPPGCYEVNGGKIGERVEVLRGLLDAAGQRRLDALKLV